MGYKIIIEPGRSEKNYWRDLWRYRELFYILSWRDVKVKYKQTVLGVVWAILRPLLTMIVFTFVFGKVANMQSMTSVPYAIIVFGGLLPWQFFSNSITECSSSLLGNTNLITKVYFPRMIIPVSSVITSFIDFFISLIILFFLFAYYQYLPPKEIFFLPFFCFLVFLTSFGPGLLLTALNVKYRDFRYIIPFIVQFGLFISPVGYLSSQIPTQWKWLYSLNPMVGIIDGFRWCIVEGTPNPFYDYTIYVSLGITLLFVWIAFHKFRKMEKSFADLI